MVILITAARGVSHGQPEPFCIPVSPALFHASPPHLSSVLCTHAPSSRSPHDHFNCGPVSARSRHCRARRAPHG
ncbi:hypothetical protein ACFFX0_08360 [Citricoccus parietis]|uniref:Uncharacterized protein n=1 Tax=Citricoccus parietis TaxID=592307 RepID=A0ABV5FX03_9MICC